MIVKTVFVPNIRKPDRIRAVCGDSELMVAPEKQKEIGDWIRNLWASQIFPEPVYVYYDIDWDADNVLYCKYERRESC